MERLSQLLLRNSDQLASPDILLINPPPDHLFQQLADAGRNVSVWNQDFGDHCWFTEQGASARFGVVPDDAPLPAQVVLIQPREKERLDMMLHFIACSLPSSGTLWLAGDNATGIKSAAKRLGHHLGHCVHLDSARHGALFSASQPRRADAGVKRHGDESAAAEFSLADYLQKWLLGSPPTELRMVSLPGAFAHGRLDEGTATLLGVLTAPNAREAPAGKVLDFGCGIGVIGLTLLQRDPTLDLTLLDSSALAIESARLSALANGLPVHLLPASGLDAVSQRFDWIVSNPPFHKGVATRYDIARDFFREARRVLTRQGKMLLVCNRHLPYEGWLKEQFDEVSLRHETRQFKVLHAGRPKSGA